MRPLTAVVLKILLLLPVSASALADALRFNIPAQPLPAALKVFASQAKMQLLYTPSAVSISTSNAVVGNFDRQAALQLLLRDTGFEVVFSAGNAATVRRTSSAPAPAAAPPEQRLHLSQADALPARPAEPAKPRSMEVVELPDELATVPEILVSGSKILNMDVPRSRDDVQPYVVFDHETLTRSGATNLESFFKDRLTQNSTGTTSSQGNTSASGSMSTVNLRGLGPNQTLILVDGRRVAGSAATGASIDQPDLNGIPLAAIERIEVLPATASGIYGGSATGGVINIVLRRSYSGATVAATYDDTFDSGSALRRFDASGGISLAGGKTNISLAGSYAEQDPLVVRERNILQRGRSSVAANNPGLYPSASNPPVGATPNIRSVNGSPLFGPGTSSFTYTPVGYTGGGGIDTFRPNAGRYNFALADSAQTVGGGDTALLNGPTIKSGIATVRQSLGTMVEVFLEGAAATNIGHSPATLASGSYTLPAGAPTNPFGQNVRVTVPMPQASGTLLTDNRSARAAAGVIMKLGAQWRAEADYTWNRARNFSSLPANTASTVTAAINGGALDILRDPGSAAVDFSPYLNPPILSGPYRSTLKNATLRAAGPLLSLPAGPLRLSALIERRDEALDAGFQIVSPTITVLSPRRSQATNSAAFEATLPLVSQRNPLRAVEELDLQAAIRWDDYSVEGASGAIVNPTPTSVIERRTNEDRSVNPTVGLRYRPLQDVTFRTSYSTGFLPPSVNQLVPSVFVGATTIIDPRRGGALVAVPSGQVTAGGNPLLEPEDSRSWSAGFVLTPRFAASLRLSVDYIRIDKSDEIRVTFQPQDFVNNEAVFLGRVTRGPAAGDPLGVGEIIAIDATAVNVAKSRIEAWDLALDYGMETSGAGAFDLFALASWQPHYTTQLLPMGPRVENAGLTSLNPLELRANAGVNWSFGEWQLGWTARYFHSYLVADASTPAGQVTILNQGGTRVPSQVYHDLVGRYQFSAAESSGESFNLLSGVELHAGIRNVFGKVPPFDAGNTVFLYSPYADPRLRSYYVSLRKTF